MSMGRTQLRAILAAGSSIVFDARARASSDVAGLQGVSNPEPEEPGEANLLPPFFEHSLLKNVILFKTIEHAPQHGKRDEALPTGLQTRLYFPYDSTQTGD